MDRDIDAFMEITSNEYPVDSGVSTEKTHCRNGHELTPENVYINIRGHKTCRMCRKKWVNRAEVNFKLKVDALSYYSKGAPKCTCCGNMFISHLCIDHIDNDGAEHRKELNGMKIYRWLKRNDYPPGFQVMCLNCNMAKHIDGECYCQNIVYVHNID